MWTRREEGEPAVGEALPKPSRDLDGWSLKETDLNNLRGPDARELAVLLHGIDLKVDTPWTYQRAADMLEQTGHPEMAITALDLWLSHPHAVDQPERTRDVHRQRVKLQERISRALRKSKSARK